MHAHGIRHNCFFPKHVFIRINPGGDVEARVIDLEKSSRRPLQLMCALRDLYSLGHYTSPAWSRTDRVRFFRRYLGVDRLNAYGKWLWRGVVARSARRSAGRR